MPTSRAAALLAAAALALAGCGDPAGDPGVVRIGHFPNVTHAHALVAHGRSRRGEGWFERRLGPGVRVEWFVANAGPDAMNAVLARAVDVVYVGPSPALTAYVRSQGAEVRVLSGATRGGGALVVPRGGRVRSAADLRGAKVATPGLGNTQDVAFRAWLLRGGLRVSLTGGDVDVVPTANPDQLAHFATGRFAAVWTVEPWVTRLETEASGEALVEAPDEPTTVLVARAAWLAARPEQARAVVEAHREVGAWLREHPEQARAEVAAEILAETRVGIAAATLERAWRRLRFDDAVGREEFEAFLRLSQSVGFLRAAPSLDRLVVALP